MKFQRFKLVRIEYNRIFLLQTGKFQYPSVTQNLSRSFLQLVIYSQKAESFRNPPPKPT